MPLELEAKCPAESLALELDRRGFGGLTPNGSAGSELPVIGPSEPFSYFTYPIGPVTRPDTSIDPKNLFDETWARLPVDCLWAFVNQHTNGWAGPCIFCLSERPDGCPVPPSPELARHWCPARCYA